MDKAMYEKHEQIAERLQSMTLLKFDKLSLLMDLEAAQIEFNLDCDAFLAADKFNFLHDILGIQHHINRKKTCLYSEPPKVVFENCFVPRFARLGG